MIFFAGIAGLRPRGLVPLLASVPKPPGSVGPEPVWLGSWPTDRCEEGSMGGAFFDMRARYGSEMPFVNR